MLGINKPYDLVGQNPDKMYEKLCIVTGIRHDPCVIDVFISLTSFINGDEAKPWWDYTTERKSVQSVKQCTA